jgi:hypothetical protein
MDTSTSELMQQIQKDNASFWDEVVVANADFEERAGQLGVTFTYDADDDTLMIDVGPRLPSLTHDIDGVRLVRIDPNSLKIVGFDIVGLKANIGELPELVDVFVALAGESARAETASRPFVQQRSNLIARHLRGMVPA